MKNFIKCFAYKFNKVARLYLTSIDNNGRIYEVFVDDVRIGQIYNFNPPRKEFGYKEFIVNTYDVKNKKFRSDEVKYFNILNDAFIYIYDKHINR